MIQDASLLCAKPVPAYLEIPFPGDLEASRRSWQDDLRRAEKSAYQPIRNLSKKQDGRCKAHGQPKGGHPQLDEYSTENQKNHDRNPSSLGPPDSVSTKSRVDPLPRAN